MGLPSSSSAVPIVALIADPFASADSTKMPRLGKKMFLPAQGQKVEYMRLAPRMASLSSRPAD